LKDTENRLGAHWYLVASLLVSMPMMRFRVMGVGMRERLVAVPVCAILKSRRHVEDAGAHHEHTHVQDSHKPNLSICSVSYSYGLEPQEYASCRIDRIGRGAFDCKKGELLRQLVGAIADHGRRERNRADLRVLIHRICLEIAMSKCTKKMTSIGCMIALLSTAVFAQQSTTSPRAGSANALTGGAEGTTTDQGTPRGPATTSGQQDGKGMSGSSSEKGNTLTGGAEGAPTDQATPSQPGAAAPSSNTAKPAGESDRDDQKSGTRGSYR